MSVDLIFLCKRRPMGRDLVEDPYGRFYNLPRLLADRGHRVRIILLDYKNGEPIDVSRNGIRWLSAPISGYLRAIRRQVDSACPDWIVGFSDTYFGILATRFAGKCGARSCVDAYDNYESYISWLAPLHWLWRRALSRATLVTAAGPGLVELMSRHRGHAPSAVVPMACDPIGFSPLDRNESRRRLDLDTTSPMVGYCGSLHRSRGVDVFFRAMELVLERRPDVRFIHSGRTWDDVPLPESLHSFGFIEEALLPPLLNSMDTLVVINRNSAFGEHSYPVKLYEAMTCQVPVVATKTRATEWILAAHADRLVVADDPQALAAAIIRSLEAPRPEYDSVPTWSSACDALEDALESAGHR